MSIFKEFFLNDHDVFSDLCNPFRALFVQRTLKTIQLILHNTNTWSKFRATDPNLIKNTHEYEYQTFF